MKGLKHSGGKVAIIDVGSNTIKVLCAENNDQRIKKLGAKSIEARLGGDQRVEGSGWKMKAERPPEQFSIYKTSL